MKTVINILLTALLLTCPRLGLGQSVVGYVNTPFGSGNTLFVNPLTQGTNSLSQLFSISIVPDGTTVSLWDSATRAFDVTSTYSSGAWSADLLLNPGTGAELTTSSAFTNTFIGAVLNRDGTLYGGGNFASPPLFTGPDGLYLLGDILPLADAGTNIFLNILGRAPNVGEQVITLGGTSTYLGNGVWDTLPTLAVGQAAFLNVGPVAATPEPTTTGLLVAGLALLRFGRRR